MECPHLVKTVKPGICALPVKRKTTNGDTLFAWACTDCRSSRSPWMCLSCGQIHCGRYVNGHAKKHFEGYNHCICINCEDLCVYCYECDEFTVNDTKTGSVQQARQFIQDIASNQLENKLKKDGSSDKLSDNEEQPPKKKTTNHVKHSIPGLRNLGNTCFMNAVLQSLSNIHQFSSFFHELPAIELRNGKSAGKQIYNTRQYKDDDLSLVEEVRKTLCALWQGGHSPVSPDSLFSVMWKIFPRFRGYQQQDAHEFMRYLLDRLHTELQGTLWLGNPQRKPSAAGSTIITFMFGGLLISQVHCTVCQSYFKKIDPFLDVSLDIPERFRPRSKSKSASNICRIQDCLQSFTDVEVLAETERYMCTNCKKRQPSTKKFWFRKLPNVLCIHVKRFEWTSFLRSKIEVFVQFPFSGLDLRPYILKPEELPDKDSTLYDLKAVVIHQGSGAGCGHYYAYAENEGIWYCFNDCMVSQVDKAIVARCKAYILYYIRRTATKDDCFVSIADIEQGLRLDGPAKSSTGYEHG